MLPLTWQSTNVSFCLSLSNHGSTSSSLMSPTGGWSAPSPVCLSSSPPQCTYLLDPGFFQELCFLIELEMCSFHLTLTTLAFLPTLHKFCYKCVSSQAAAPARCPVLHQMVPVILQNSCTACHNQPHYIFSTESGQTSNREDLALKQTVWITPAAGDFRNRLGKH